LLPPHCLTCDAPVAVPGQLCAACFRLTSFLGDPCCRRCGRGFEGAAVAGDGVCAFCAAAPPSWGTARAALRYDEQSKKILLPLKYSDRIENAAALGGFMARAGAALVMAADWLVPVPLHRGRLRTRRYNQAALLAQAVARQGGRPVILDALHRIHPTRKLASGSAEQRMAELKGAFAVNGRRWPMLEGSRVLLIDDVLTSGSTAETCTRVLLAAGVVRVDVLAGARAADPRLS